jgi:hypothetical protein
MKILIVEDDNDIAEILANELSVWGYDTVCVKDFNNVLDEFKSEKPELVLMDIILPYFNGFYWCQKIREVSKVPLMFISSKSEDIDIVQAMQFGGDDYIVKPINIQIVRAKIVALLRRSYDFVEETDYLIFGNVKLLLSAAKLEFMGKVAELTRTELMILETLFKDRGAVSKRDKIMDKCWQEENFIDDNTLAVNMTRLRKKLAEIGLDDFIQTKKGIGYFLNNKLT